MQPISILLLLLTASAASFTAFSRTTPAGRGPAAVTAIERPAIIATVRMMAEEEAADDATPEAAQDAEAAAGAEDNDDKAPAADDEEDEEDLLNTPAFLKQKLKVLEKELADVEAETAQAQAEASEVSEEWVQKRTRLQADFDNFNARHRNQTLEAQLEARIKLLQEFLPVLDNFDRARASIGPDGEEQEATNARYQEMHARLMATLSELGMEKMDVVGQEFDYNLHMAIQQVPSDEYEENIVCSEMQPGYTCKGNLVRAAYVMVSAG